jgi:tetratricopeptide (TPR) repeat protein
MSLEQENYDFVKDAQSLIDTKQFDKAVFLLKESIKNMPSDWQPFIESENSQDRFFWNQPEFTSFIDYNRATLDKSVFWRFPSYSKAYYLLAYILSDQGRFREALSEIENGLAIEPDHPRLLCEKAFILGKFGDDETALVYLQQAPYSRPFLS